MYTKFFGFKERPFKLVPNPDYLYLSRSHEEALAHLAYAVSEGDGFMEITGEVGTGKTTLCRAFLENLDENTEVAFIFNPKLDSIQLLKTINDEFEISSEADSVKALIDTLNAFLIEKKREGKNVILLIDEAQNLSKAVLEQLRLLSNLETTRDKLLQIILVGQPELGDMLDSQELRQLGQRITLSCHLRPFTGKETKAYISHRINIASQKAGVKFTRDALRIIYKYSGGIPRLINIVCDRALLTAFGLDQKTVNAAVTRAAIRELSGRGEISRFGFFEKRQALYIGSIACLALVLVIFTLTDGFNIGTFFASKSEISSTLSSTAQNPELLPAKFTPIAKPKPSAGHSPTAPELKTNARIELGLADYLKAINIRESRKDALTVAMDMWGRKSEIKSYLADVNNDQDFFHLATKQNAFLIHRVESDLDLVKKLNLPAVLEFYVPGILSPVYLAICRIDGDMITLRSKPGDYGITVEIQELDTFYAGVAYIPWKNFYGYKGIVPVNSPKDTILTLKMHIRDIGFEDVEISPVYDEKTRETVKKIQEKHGLPVDGLVGPLTKIVLYNEIKMLNVPQVTSQ